MKPDKKGTTYLLLSPEKRVPPKIVFGSTAIKWINALVEAHSQEVGFYGAVDTREDGSYFIRDIFYPKHSEMHAATCEISTEGESDIMEYLFSKGRDEDIPKMKKFWGHSHHTMGTGPSQQDENQAMDMMKSNNDFIIRAICNKDGEMSVSFFDAKNQVRFDHIKWTVEDDSSEEILIDKLAQISGIMENEEVDNKSKIEEIDNVIKEDVHTESITKKIEELKKENIPVPAYTPPSNFNHGYGSQYNNYQHFNGSKKNETQQSLFERSGNGQGSFNNRSGAFQEEDTYDFQNDPDSLYDDKEVDDMMNAWGGFKD